VTAFVVLFLHDVRGVSVATAALCLSLGQLLGASVRIGTGVWSDRVRSRVGPLRKISVAIALTVGFAAAVQEGPLAFAFAAFVVAGGVSMGWNTVSFAAAVELGGTSRGGATVGFQQAVLGLVAGVTPFAFAFFVGATSWTAAWWAVAAFPIIGWAILRGLPLNEEYRRRRRRDPDPAV
jgi:MFS family permease